MKFVNPLVFMVGHSEIDLQGLRAYLDFTDNREFMIDVEQARLNGVSGGEILCSTFAKLCYKSLTLGQNKNISRTRSIEDNLKSCIDSCHGSVFEHASINFIATNVSRVLTHELVRHRAGFAHSQTSGRYVRGDSFDLVWDPILEPVRGTMTVLCGAIKDTYIDMCNKMGLNGMKGLKEAFPDQDEDHLRSWIKEKAGVDDLDNISFEYKKKATSALRRILPNGIANEIAFSVNLRALRHTVQLRTSRHAETEIRDVFSQVFTLVRDRYPMIFCDAKVEMVNEIPEVSGMVNQPYEKKQ